MKEDGAISPNHAMTAAGAADTCYMTAIFNVILHTLHTAAEFAVNKYLLYVCDVIVILCFAGAAVVGPASSQQDEGRLSAKASK
jgi:hypothetical protein